MRDFDQAALDALMADYDRQFPKAPDFNRGSFHFEARKILGRLKALGATIVLPEETPR